MTYSANGIERIARERLRQVMDEGYGAEHDTQHTDGELRLAALCYTMGHTQFWPDRWDDSSWKPTRDPIRDLTKAGALIAAEIDRLLREQGCVVAGIPSGDLAEDVTVQRRDLDRMNERRSEMKRVIEERGQRISQLNLDVANASAGLAKALTERDDARFENRELRLHSSRLVELLDDSWWVEAAYALNRLKELTGVD